MTEAHSPSHTSPGQLQGLLTPVTPVLGSVLVLPLPPASVGILILSTLLCSKAPMCVPGHTSDYGGLGGVRW